MLKKQPINPAMNEHQQVMSSSQVRTLLAVLMLLGFVSAAGLTTIYLMLATLYREYADQRAAVGWVVTSYLLVSAISAAVCGRLGDLLGRRALVQVVLAISSLGALLSASSHLLWVVVIGCALQGVAGSLTPLGIGLAREHLPLQKVPVALGVVTAAGMFGAGVAYLMAGLIVENFASHGGFVFKALIALSAMGAVAVFVPPARQHRSSLQGIDVWRGLLFAPALAAVLVAVQQARELGWSDGRVLAGLLGGCALLVMWVLHQAKQPVPLINVRMLAHRRVFLTNLATVFVALGSVQLGQTFSLMLQQPSWTGIGHDLSPTRLGWVLLPLNALSLVMSPLSGRYGHRVGEFRAALLGAGICLTAWLLLLLVHDEFWQVMTAAVLSTCGYAFLMPALHNLIAKASPPERASEAAGTNYVIFACFMAVGSQVIFALLSTGRVSGPVNSGLSFPSASAWLLEFGYIAAMCVLCLLSVLMLHPRGGVGATAVPGKERQAT
jgi:MFS family permease